MNPAGIVINLNTDEEIDGFIKGLFYASLIYEVNLGGKEGAWKRAENITHTILSANFPHYYDTKEVN